MIIVDAHCDTALSAYEQNADIMRTIFTLI